MGSPTIFSGRRTKLLTADGVLNSDGSIIDNNGVVNYIKNGHAEVNALLWSTYANAAAARPTNGSGGAPTVTFTRSTVAPFDGQGSFLYTSPGAVQGQGAAYDFVIAPTDKAKVLQISFDYMVNSGTFVAGTNTSDSDLIVTILDVTNNVIIEPSSIKLLSNNTTLTDKFQASFQTSSNSVGYRLILHSATASAAFSLKLDNISVSPSTYVYGTPVTDEVSWTPALTNAGNATVTATRQRIGDNIRLLYRITIGSSLPTGTIAVSKPSDVAFTFTANQAIPDSAAKGINNATGATWHGVARWDNTNGRIDILGGNGQGFWNASVPFTWAANDDIYIVVQTKVVGLSSSVQMSDQTDTRVVDLVANGAGGAVTANVTNIPTTTTNKDSHGAWTGSTYVVPVAGDYIVNGLISGPSVSTLNWYLNGAVQNSLVVINSANFTPSFGQTLPNLKAGDIVSFRSDVTQTLTLFRIGLSKISGPSAIAATESINARYTNSSGQSIPTGTTATVLTGWTKVYDTHGWFNATTGVWTAGIQGKFEFSFSLIMQTASFTAATVPYASVFKNGSAYSNPATYPIQTTGSTYPAFTATEQVEMLAGDTVSIAIDHGETTARTMLPSAIYNSLRIKRVGN